jgi:hypothetical protein
LVLFADGVTYSKSAAKQMWAIFACIPELPPMLRFSYENILFVSLWSGPNLDFNLFFKEYTEIDDLIINGLVFNQILLTFSIHAFIGDSPARSKVCNSMQHNGYFGCLMCLHPADRSSKKRTTIYPLLKESIKIRTNKLYALQANEADNTGNVVAGIKGSTYLSNWITIPDSVLFDYMHLCLIGTFKSLIMSFFKSNNHARKEFYLGNY